MISKLRDKLREEGLVLLFLGAMAVYFGHVFMQIYRQWGALQ